MEVKLCLDSMKLESPSTEYSSGSESSPAKSKPSFKPQPKYKREEIRRIQSKRKIFPGPGVIEEEMDSLDSVLTNLPLTIVPTYASNLSKISRQSSTRWVKRTYQNRNHSRSNFNRKHPLCGPIIIRERDEYGESWAPGYIRGSICWNDYYRRTG